jgi:hypothetical protein
MGVQSIGMATLMKAKISVPIKYSLRKILNREASERNSLKVGVYIPSQNIHNTALFSPCVLPIVGTVLNATKAAVQKRG